MALSACTTADAQLSVAMIYAREYVCWQQYYLIITSSLAWESEIQCHESVFLDADQRVAIIFEWPRWKRKKKQQQHCVSHFAYLIAHNTYICDWFWKTTSIEKGIKNKPMGFPGPSSLMNHGPRLGRTASIHRLQIVLTSQCNKWTLIGGDSSVKNGNMIKSDEAEARVGFLHAFSIVKNEDRKKKFVRRSESWSCNDDSFILHIIGRSQNNCRAIAESKCHRRAITILKYTHTHTHTHISEVGSRAMSSVRFENISIDK